MCSLLFRMRSIENRMKRERGYFFICRYFYLDILSLEQNLKALIIIIEILTDLIKSPDKFVATKKNLSSSQILFLEKGKNVV